MTSAAKPIMADLFLGKTCSNCRKRHKCPEPAKGTVWCYGYRKDKAAVS